MKTPKFISRSESQKAARSNAGTWRAESRSGRPQPIAVPETLPQRRRRWVAEGASAMAEHLAQKQAIDERTRQLRALRLAREKQQIPGEKQSAPRRMANKVRRPFVQRPS
jgi:hypothetical protein